MLADGLWLSIGLGAALGVAYVAVSFLSNKRAMRSGRHALLIVVAAMTARILVALTVLVAVLLLLPVAPTAFLGSFFVMFILGLAVEIWFLHSREAPEHETDFKS